MQTRSCWAIGKKWGKWIQPLSDGRWKKRNTISFFHYFKALVSAISLIWHELLSGSSLIRTIDFRQHRLYTTKLIRQLHCISSYFLSQRTGRTGRQGWSHGSPGITRDTRKPRNNRDARNTRNNRLGSETHYCYSYFWQMENKICFLQAKKIDGVMYKHSFA